VLAGILIVPHKSDFVPTLLQRPRLTDCCVLERVTGEYSSGISSGITQWRREFSYSLPANTMIISCTRTLHPYKLTNLFICLAVQRNIFFWGKMASRRAKLSTQVHPIPKSKRTPLPSLPRIMSWSCAQAYLKSLFLGAFAKWKAPQNISASEWCLSVRLSLSHNPWMGESTFIKFDSGEFYWTLFTHDSFFNPIKVTSKLRAFLRESRLQLTKYFILSENCSLQPFTLQQEMMREQSFWPPQAL
jgi:hypothetical protein